MSDAKLPIRILLSNDDGINAPGLVSLEKIARSLSDDVWVVAPEAEEGGASGKVALSGETMVENSLPMVLTSADIEPVVSNKKATSPSCTESLNVKSFSTRVRSSTVT